jgi:hypothetical protein
MRLLIALLGAALCAGGLGACANDDPYVDPMYRLKRDLYHRNQRWDNTQERMRMRRKAQDERYGSWFDNVME